MIDYILIILFSIFSYEIIKFCNLFNIIKKYLECYKNFFKLINNKNIEEKDKQILIINNSKELIFLSMKVIAIILLLFISIFIFNILFNNFYLLILNFISFIQIIIISFFYHKLGNKLIKKSLFEIEKIIYLKKVNFKLNKHVFISSLPRSGTTILLNSLYTSGSFASLKYSNMPFITSPNLSRLFYKKKINKTERPHKDGLMFDLDSPESFDEVFFFNL